jgi:hypothetical protein
LSYRKATFPELKSKLEKLNQDAIRNRKFDFDVISPDEIDQKLLEGTQHAKRQLLLTQIGYLRINLFQEYYERRQAAQENKDLDKAIQLMNQYLQTKAMPFIQQRLHPSILTRIRNRFSTSSLPDTSEDLEEWHTHTTKLGIRNKKPEHPATEKQLKSSNRLRKSSLHYSHSLSHPATSLHGSRTISLRESAKQVKL